MPKLILSKSRFTMQVVEKTHHINVNLSGEGAEEVAALVKEHIPNTQIFDDDDEAVEWESSDLAKEIRAEKSPGALVRAYRERSGLTLVELAHRIGTKYPNLSAIENDRRAIGLALARKLGEALGVEYHKFLD
jgi:antitoxin component HigA of HigAB toxin-antitoxin module